MPDHRCLGALVQIFEEEGAEHLWAWFQRFHRAENRIVRRVGLLQVRMISIERCDTSKETGNRGVQVLTISRGDIRRLQEQGARMGG